MATKRVPFQYNTPYTTVFPDVIGNQISTSNPVGTFVGFVMSAGVGADNGMRLTLKVPTDYASTPRLIVTYLLDGSPGASDTLGTGASGLCVPSLDTEDAAFSAEDADSVTIGSSGLGAADEDMLEVGVDLDNLTLVATQLLLLNGYLDVSGTSYAGNAILQAAELEYDDGL